MLDASFRIVVDYIWSHLYAIIPGLSKDALILLRRILLQYYDEPMEIMEKIAIDFLRLISFRKVSSR